MIVIVASRHDARASRIAARWGSRAAVMDVEDLCTRGWVFDMPTRSGMKAVVAGRVVPTDAIDGILTLRPWVDPAELHRTRPEDRSYVAAELNAFLLAWLAAQRCPVLNRPTACCLAGPQWTRARWTQTAIRLSIPVAATRRASANDASSSTENVEVIAVGDLCFGSDDATLRSRTVRLARASDVDLLAARFAMPGGEFVDATSWPSLADDRVVDAVLGRFEGAR